MTEKRTKPTVRPGETTTLDEGEAKFLLLAEMTPFAVFIFQGNRFKYANPAAERLTGYSKQELLNSSFTDLLPTGRKKIMREWGMQVQRGDTLSLHQELNIITKVGDNRRIDLTAAAISYEGKPAVIGTAYEINEKQKEEILQDVVYRIAQAADRSKTLDDLFPALHAIISEVMVARNFILLFSTEKKTISPILIIWMNTIILPGW